MSLWTNYLQDPRPLRAVFADQAPDLGDVLLKEIILDRHDPIFWCILDVPDFPQAPPQTWSIAQYNRVEITLGFQSITQLKLEGWSNNRCAFEISPCSMGYHLSIMGPSIKASLYAEALVLPKVRGYTCQNTERVDVGALAFA